MKEILNISLLKESDPCPTFDHIGKYTNIFEPGVICCQAGCVCPRKGICLFFKEECLKSHSTNVQWFKAYAGGLPTEDNEQYNQYAIQDYQQMLRFTNSEIEMLHYFASALLRVSGIPSRINSFGIGNIQSDWGPDQIKNFREEELRQLREMLLELGFTSEEIENAPKNG